jgi:hypothetical protein
MGFPQMTESIPCDHLLHDSFDNSIVIPTREEVVKKMSRFCQEFFKNVKYDTNPAQSSII